MTLSSRAAAARLIAALLALSVVPVLSAQQAPPRAWILGDVTDSIHSRPLAGALVMVTRLSPEPALYLSAIADQAGRFRFDSLTGGRYAIGFSAPMLDSLDIVPPPQQIVLGDDEHLSLPLATPSETTLEQAACPGVALLAGEGAVVGTVIDADTERPIIGATVVVSWSDLSFDTKTMHAVSKDHVGAVKTDSLGQYRMCRVPSGSRLLLQAQHAERAGAAVATIIDDSVGVARRNFSLSPREAQRIAAAEPTGDTASSPILTGTATLTGVVRGQGEQPLRDAHVTVDGARGSAVTDSLGRYSLTGLPAGTQVVEVRRIGYFVGRGDVDLRSGRTAVWDAQLSKFITLDSVRIIARKSMYPEFTRNKKSSPVGKFFDEDAIARRNAQRTSDILRTIPGLKVVPSPTGFGDVVVSSRGAGWSAHCAMSVVIDGVQGEDLNDIVPADIGAMEVYVSSIGAPPMYVKGDCGVIVIHTKR